MKREILCVRCKTLLVTIDSEGMTPAAPVQLKVGPIKGDGSRDTELICPTCAALTPYDIDTPPELH